MTSRLDVVHLVDTIEVEPEHLAAYVELVETVGVPTMTDAGASLVSSTTTASDIGEAVLIQVVWGFADHEAWNEIRKNLVLDPGWHDYARRAAALRRGGTRRFYYPTSVAPQRVTPSTDDSSAMMLRRFEIYSVAASASREKVARLDGACRHCGRYIPAVLDSAVGRNLSDAPAQMVWEHAFASPDAYRRYMVHPFHAAVLDRYLLADSPERIVGDDVLAAGLVGYQCDSPRYRMAKGVRRLVLLQVERAAPGADVARLQATLTAVPAEVDEMALSVVAENTMGPAWFDGVTPIAGPPRWTHLWEQGFTSLDALEAYRRGGSVVAEAERRAWEGFHGGVVRRSAELYYELDGVQPWP
jgi:hypothetical protein